MDMNLFNIMGFGAPGAMSGLGMDAPAAGSLGQTDASGEFVNLLDLVSEMEVGEFQNQSAEDWMGALAGEIQTNDARSLEMEKQTVLLGLGKGGIEGEESTLKSLLGISDLPVSEKAEGSLDEEVVALLAPNAAQASMAQSTLLGIEPKKASDLSKQLNVGQKVSTEKLSETQLLNEWAMDSMALVSDRNLQAITAPGKPSAEATAQWANAIANGDLKSVEIIPSTDENAAAKIEAGLSELMITKDGSLVEKDAIGLDKRMAREPILADKVIEVAPKSEKREIAEPASALVSPKQMPEAAKVAKPEGFVAMSTKDLPHVKLEKKVEAASIKNSKSGLNLSAESQSAKDFMLQNEVGMSDGGTQLQPKVLAPLANASKLGSVEDARVSHQAIDFVADKVDTLRMNGGGVLRVHLDPKDLGSVMLKVSSRGGLAKVEIVAEKPETAAIFQQNKAELSARLESSGVQALVSVDQGRALSGATLASASSAAKSAQGSMSSFDLLNLDRTGHSEANNSSTASPLKSASGSSGAQTSTGEGASDSWSREERREFAREQWNASRQNRKTA